MVKIRLMRMGAKKRPFFRVVVADSRSPRDGRFIENIGKYHPMNHPSVIDIDEDRAIHWLKEGAQPTDPVRVLLEKTGIWDKFQGGPGTPVPPPPDEEPAVKAEAPAEAPAEPEAASAEEAPAEEAPAEPEAQEAPAEEAPAEEAPAEETPTEPEAEETPAEPEAKEAPSEPEAKEAPDETDEDEK